MAGLFKPYGLVAAGVVGWLVVCLPVQAFVVCGIGGTGRQTLTSDVDQACMVLYGVLANANRTSPTDAPEGTTDLIIEHVIKPHQNLKTAVITLPGYTNLGPDGGSYRYLVFIDIFKGKIDPYRGIVVKADSELLRYLKGAVELKDQKPEKRLRYFFDYLDNGEASISNDAYQEFVNAGYKEYCHMAKTLPADRIAAWLMDPTKTPRIRIGLYASLLGFCGKQEHACLLRAMLEDAEKQATGGVDGMLIGYVMLKPKEGWHFLKGILKDPRKKFLDRYAALKAARFFWDLHHDLVSKKDLTEGLLPLLDMKDISDLVIEDFREWGCWEFTDRILALQSSPVNEIKCVKRSILRFALHGQGQQGGPGIRGR